jgi:hypothetical protein
VTRSHLARRTPPADSSDRVFLAGYTTPHSPDRGLHLRYHAHPKADCQARNNDVTIRWVPAGSRNCDYQRSTTTTELFVERLEDLLDSTPAPLRSTAQKVRLLSAYVDVLLTCPPMAGLLAGWPRGVLGGLREDSSGRPTGGWDARALAEPAACSAAGLQRVRAATDAIGALLAGPDADLAGRVRAAVALAGLAGVVAGCPDSPVEAVRSTAVASSIEALEQ